MSEAAGDGFARYMIDTLGTSKSMTYDLTDDEWKAIREGMPYNGPRDEAKRRADVKRRAMEEEARRDNFLTGRWEPEPVPRPATGGLSRMQNDATLALRTACARLGDALGCSVRAEYQPGSMQYEVVLSTMRPELLFQTLDKLINSGQQQSAEPMVAQAPTARFDNLDLD